jgi:hypothetical protein
MGTLYRFSTRAGERGNASRTTPVSGTPGGFKNGKASPIKWLKSLIPVG